jgi:hypothetical protein
MRWAPGPATSRTLGTLFVILAILAFAIAIYIGYLGNIVGALVVAFIGVLILLFA